MKIASKMYLSSDDYKEYERRHLKVYPELESKFKESGVSSYSIWYDQTSNELFAYIELESLHIWENIAESEICKKWWIYMADIMETNFDYSPVNVELIKVYDYQ